MKCLVITSFLVFTTTLACQDSFERASDQRHERVQPPPEADESMPEFVVEPYVIDVGVDQVVIGLKTSERSQGRLLATDMLGLELTRNEVRSGEFSQATLNLHATAQVISRAHFTALGQVDEQIEVRGLSPAQSYDFHILLTDRSDNTLEKPFVMNVTTQNLKTPVVIGGEPDPAQTGFGVSISTNCRASRD